MNYDIQAYGRDPREVSKDVRNAVWGIGRQLRAMNAMPARPRLQPITDAIEIPTIDEAIHALFMATARYYLDRAARGLWMTREVSALLLAMHGAIRGTEDCIVVLNDALTYLVHSVASIEDTAVRNAIKAAQLSLKSLQSTWAEMPATAAEWRSERWLRH